MAGGGGGDPLHVGPWGGWLWLWEAPAWAVLRSSRPLKEGEEKRGGKSALGFSLFGIWNRHVFTEEKSAVMAALTITQLHKLRVLLLLVNKRLRAVLSSYA